jgi:outer membrane protein assembly factor BamD
MKLIFSLFLVSFLFSCSGTRPEGQTEAEVLFKEAEDMYAKKRYIMATEKLNQIRSQYPYSFYAVGSELMQADIYFEQGNYVEAAAAYLLFRDFHPRHEKAAYVVWKIAESYYFQLPKTYDRDLTSGIEASRFYREILSNHSKTEYAQEARTKINEIDQRILSREKYIADFYFKTKVYDSARHRYLIIIDRFKDEDLRSYSMARVLMSSYHLKEREECEQFYQKFSSQVNQKHEREFKDAYSRCTKI